MTTNNSILLEVMLHYYYRDGDYCFDSVSAKEAMHKCLRHRLLDHTCRNYPDLKITPKGIVYVKSLLNVGFPTSKELWVANYPRGD